MDRRNVRRVGAGIILISFFFPWMDAFIADASGFALIMEGFSEGIDYGITEAIFIAVLLIVLVLLAVWQLLKPSALPHVFLGVLGIPVILFSFTEEFSAMKMYGIDIFSLGIVITVFVSLFIKTEGQTNERQSVNQGPHQASQASSIQSSMPPEKVCNSCGHHIDATLNFCPECGMSQLPQAAETKAQIASEKEESLAYCTYCSAQLKENYKFCRECGEAVRS